MQTAPHPFDIRALQASWQVFDTMAHLRPMRSDAEFERLATMMN